MVYLLLAEIILLSVNNSVHFLYFLRLIELYGLIQMWKHAIDLHCCLCRIHLLFVFCCMCILNYFLLCNNNVAIMHQLFFIAHYVILCLYLLQIVHADFDEEDDAFLLTVSIACLLYTSPSPRD